MSLLIPDPRTRCYRNCQCLCHSHDPEHGLDALEPRDADWQSDTDGYLEGDRRDYGPLLVDMIKLCATEIPRTLTNDLWKGKPGELLSRATPRIWGALLSSLTLFSLGVHTDYIMHKDASLLCPVVFTLHWRLKDLIISIDESVDGKINYSPTFFEPLKGAGKPCWDGDPENLAKHEEDLKKWGARHLLGIVKRKMIIYLLHPDFQKFTNAAPKWTHYIEGSDGDLGCPYELYRNALSTVLTAEQLSKIGFPTLRFNGRQDDSVVYQYEKAVWRAQRVLRGEHVEKHGLWASIKDVIAS